MDDSIAVGGELFVARHLVVSNENARIVSLACVDEDLHVVADMKFVAIGVDSLVANVDEGLSMKNYV